MGTDIFEGFIGTDAPNWCELGDHLREILATKYEYIYVKLSIRFRYMNLSSNEGDARFVIIF